MCRSGSDLAELLEASGEEDAALKELDAGIRVRPGATARFGSSGARYWGGWDGTPSRSRSFAAPSPSCRIRSRPSCTSGCPWPAAAATRTRFLVLERATALDPARGDVAFHLGEAWYHAGQPERALQNLMRATELAPGDPRAYKLLGRLLDRLGSNRGGDGDAPESPRGRPLKTRRAAGSVIVGSWLCCIGWAVARQVTRPPEAYLETRAARLAPGAAFYQITLGDSPWATPASPSTRCSRVID